MRQREELRMTSHENKAWRPQARREGLVVEPAGDELMVYDLNRHKVHCLNAAAAKIWRLCDDNHSIEELADQFAVAMDAPLRERIVRTGVGKLRVLKLLENDERTWTEQISRRKLVKSLGMSAAAAAVAIPMITTILAPTIAFAASCRKNGMPCTLGSQCCSGHCNMEGMSFVCSSA